MPRNAREILYAATAELTGRNRPRRPTEQCHNASLLLASFVKAASTPSRHHGREDLDTVEVSSVSELRAPIEMLPVCSARAGSLVKHASTLMAKEAYVDIYAFALYVTC